MPHDIERRAVRAELRAAEDAPAIEGYAAVFNAKSEDLGGFREVIMASAFDRAVRDRHDVRALVNHDPNQVLGRTKSGTLNLEVDETGLRAKITPPDTQAGRDVVTSVKRGDLDGMSFAFRTITDNWRVDDGAPLRELVDLELVDVSVVAYPAYNATSVSARALDQARRARGVPNEINAARLAVEWAASDADAVAFAQLVLRAYRTVRE